MDESSTKRRGPLLWLYDHLRYWQVGFLVGAAPPLAIAGYWMIHDRMTRPPNEAGCGTGIAMMLIFVAPACSIIGTVLGFAVSAICQRDREK